MTQAEPRAALSDEDLKNILALMQGADTVELKLTVPDEKRRSTTEALGVDPLDAQIRQVYFFDTPDLRLFNAGLVVRARRTQQKPDDSVVKLRPVVPEDLPADLRAVEDFGVEVDAMPGGYVCSASFKGKLSTPRVRDASLGGTPVHELFSKKQRAFYEDHTPEGLGLDDLSMMGPIVAFKLKLTPEGFNRRLALELWNYPDGSRIFELSTKCTPSEAFQVAAEARAYLGSKGIDLFGEQETKTRTALDFYASSTS